MNTQDFIDQKLRTALGNMHVELILQQARIAELEEQVQLMAAQAIEAQAEPEAISAKQKPNGKHPAPEA